MKIRNVTYRKEIKHERSEYLISSDKLATDQRSGALSGSRSGSDNVNYEKNDTSVKTENKSVSIGLSGKDNA